jgi:hypothetical protein
MWSYELEAGRPCEKVPQSVPARALICAKYWSEWQVLALSSVIIDFPAFSVIVSRSCVLALCTWIAPRREEARR